MSYRTKSYIALIVFILGALLVFSGYSELSGSFGARDAINSGLWKLGFGVLLVAVAAPLRNYYRARSKQIYVTNDPAIAELAKIGEQNLKEQEKREKNSPHP